MTFVTGLEHVNTRSVDVEKTRRFYERCLDLRAGPRPAFASNGYWMYLGDHPVLHLVQRPAGEAAHADSGNVDHLAFRGSDRAGFLARLADEGVPFLDRGGQIFIHDPDGLKIEISFKE